MSAVEGTWGGARLTLSETQAPTWTPGKHSFVLVATFHVRDPAGSLLLDHENLHHVALPRCWWCRATEDDGTPCSGLPA